MEIKAGVKTFYAKTQKECRKWLEKNHRSEKVVWLIFYKKGSEKQSTNYAEALEEALCFRWIDSKANKRDEMSYYPYFAKRPETTQTLGTLACLQKPIGTKNCK